MSTLAARPSSDRDVRGPLAIAAGVVTAAAVGGLATNPDSDWFRNLEQPAWAPPNWLFAPVWTTLYVMIIGALSVVWRRTPEGERRTLGVLVAANLALNLAWTLIFFRGEAPVAAGVEIVVLEGTTIALIVAAWPRSRAAALALVPYAMWVAFATALTWRIASLN